MPNIDALQLEVMGIVSDAIPEIVTDPYPVNFYTTLQGSLLSVVEQAKRAAAGVSGTPSLPYVFLDIGDVARDQSFGIVPYHRAPITIYYMGLTGEADQNSVHAILESLREQIDASDAAFATFAPVEEGRVDTSPSNAFARALFVNAKSLLVGGYVSWEPGWLI